MRIFVYSCKTSLLCLCILGATVGAQTWTSHAPTPTPRWYPGSALLNGKIYVIGGQDSTYPYQSLNTVEVYDPAQNIWETKAPMNVDRWGLAVAVVNDKIYAIGGRTGSASQGHSASDVVEEYDVQTNTWTSKAIMPTARGYCGCGVYHDTIFVFGGRLVSAVAAVEKYYPADDSWTAEPPMPYGRYTFATARVDTHFYLIGGWNVNTVQAYNLKTRTWHLMTPMPTPRGGSGAGTLEGYIYIVGGRGGLGDEFERYDTFTDSWSTLTPMPTAREGLTACVAGSELYAITGSAPISQGGLPYYGQNEKASDLTRVHESDKTGIKILQLHTKPNPGRGRIVITYTIPHPGEAELRIYDCTGRQVTKLATERQFTDVQITEWACCDDRGNVVPPGVYFVYLKAGELNDMSKVLIAR